jgi:hypothetical protein
MRPAENLLAVPESLETLSLRMWFKQQIVAVTTFPEQTDATDATLPGFRELLPEMPAI